MGKKAKSGYLYLMEVRPRRPWLHKIGITQNPAARFDSLEESNGAPTKVLRVIFVRDYAKHEAYLKDYFSNRQRFYAPLKGNGGTEVFRFTMLDLMIVTLYMEFYALWEDWRARLGFYVFALVGFLACFYIWSPDLFFWTFKEFFLWARRGFS